MKAVIFDLDGTLTDTLTAISYFGNIALDSIALPPIEKKRYGYLVGNGRDVLIHRMLAEYNVDTEENFDKVGSVYDEHYEADPMYKTDAYDGIKDVLSVLKERGIKLAVCTNKPDNVAQDVIKMIFGTDTFDFVCGMGENSLAKPDPSRALLIADILGVKCTECLFTGDTSVDMQTAKNAGMTAIGVLWGFRDRQELEDSGADYIISSPQEYLNYI